MNLLERVKKIRGAERALGITFSAGHTSDARLPEGVRLFGYSDTICFCFAEGYQETVFAVHDLPGHPCRIQPIAYDFQEFLRLIFACGCAELAAASAYLPEHEYREEFSREWRKPHTGLVKLREMLLLTPIRNPYDYTHTVGQVIDGSRLLRSDGFAQKE